MGVIVAPPGSGKTIIGLSIIAQKKQPALIIVHRRQLLDQWIQRIQAFLGIPKYKIGRIAKGKIEIGERITVAMIQSLNNPEIISKIESSFGTIIIDECHHLPSDTYVTVLQQLHTYYLYVESSVVIYQFHSLDLYRLQHKNKYSLCYYLIIQTNNYNKWLFVDLQFIVQL